MIAEPPVAAFPDFACGFEPLDPPTTSDAGTLTAESIKKMFFAAYLEKKPSTVYTLGGSYVLHPNDVVETESKTSGNLTEHTVKINGKVVSVEYKVSALDWVSNLYGVTVGYAAPAPVVDPATLPDLETFPAEVKFDVTSVDIAKGIRGQGNRCAVARSANRRFDGAEVGVAHTVVNVFGPEGLVAATYAAGPEMSEFIMAFDGGRKVKPTTFTLRRVS